MITRDRLHGYRDDDLQARAKSLLTSARRIAVQVRRLVRLEFDQLRFSLRRAFALMVGFAFAAIAATVLTVIAVASIVDGTCAAFTAMLGSRWAGSLVGGTVVVAAVGGAGWLVWRTVCARFERRLRAKYDG